MFTIKKEYKLKGERNISARKPLIYNNCIYVIFIYDKKGFIESRLQCLDLETFALKWEYTHNHVLNNIEISSSDKLLCGCMNGEVKCFNPSSGENIWNFKTEESNIGAISNIYNDKIIFSGIQAKSKSTWCLDVNTGKSLWQIENKGHAYIPLIADNNGFFCIGNSIYSVSLEDGTLNWEQYEPDTYIFNPKKYDDTIVVGGHGKINIYDFNIGELKLSIETGIRSSITEICFDSNNNLYFGDGDGNFYCCHLEFIQEPSNKRKLVAEQKWSYKAKGAVKGTPALLDKFIYFISDGKELISLDIFNGELNWSFNTKGKADISGVSIVNDEFFIASGNGHVHRLKS